MVLPIIQNQSKTNNNLQQFSIQKPERFHGGFFEVKMLEIFTRAFFIKNHYWNLKLSIVALSSVIKCST